MGLMSQKPSRLSLSRRSHLGEADPARALHEALALSHADCIDLTATRPEQVDLPLPEYARFLSDTEAAYSPEPRGLWEARQTVARLYDSRARITPEQVILTASTSESYSVLLKTLCDPGDAILIPEPSYPLFEHLARLSDVTVHRYKLAYDGAFHVDLSSLPSRQEAERRGIRALFCVSPENPTGHHLTKEEWERMSELGLPLVIDEVFLAYSDTTEHFDALSREHTQHTNTVILDGLSKRALAPGLKCGWMVVSGPSETQLLERLDWVLDAYLSVGNPVMRALDSILSASVDPRAAVIERLKENRAYLSHACKGTAMTMLPVDGGWTAIVKLPATQTESEWETAVARKGLRVHFGSMFGFEGGPYLLLSLLVPAQKFARGLQRLSALVQAEVSGAAANQYAKPQGETSEKPERLI